MTIEQLRIRSLRNHKLTTLACPAGIVLLWGENGAGKTTVLEGISMLCTTRSFVTTQDRVLLTAGETTFDLSGRFRSDAGSQHMVEVQYGAAARKAISFDHARVPSAADVIGRFPLVALSPHHRAITAGGPTERRSFIDFVVSQVHHSYLLDLIEYRRILKQRNALLMRSDLSYGQRVAQLDPWTRTFAEHAVRIVRRRCAFLAEFFPYFDAAMRDIAAARELPALRYSPSAGIDYDADDAVDLFEQAARARIDADVRRGSTGLGPHRDELELLVNGLDVRAHASQGQHKSMLIALKIGEARYLADRLDERPMLLFDDIFAELDDVRLARILDLVRPLGQVFITTANASVAQLMPSDDDQVGVFHVADGRVVREAVPT